MVFDPKQSREDRLLEEFHCWGWNHWARFTTLVLGQRYHLGRHLPLGVSNPLPMDYYLIWCSVHGKYEASYLHSYDEVTVCRECEEERRQELARPRVNGGPCLVLEDGHDLF